MNKLILLYFIAIPLLVFSQGDVNNEINWLPLETAELLSKDSNKNMIFF